MTIYLANVSPDHVHTYRQSDYSRHPICAFAGPAEAMLSLKREYPAWNLYGHPDARDGMFLLARQGLAISNVGINDGAQRLIDAGTQWHAMTEADVAEFVA